jgi:peptidoglycan/xylan/chitin deacetylase (PgdA/CDA1 family)
MPSTLSDFILYMTARLKNGGLILNNHTQGREQIRVQIETLGTHFEFIHHNQLLSCLRQKRSKPFCLLTFDDGKKIHAAETAPELERLGVPAVFYVPTEFLYHNEPLWFDLYGALRQTVGDRIPGMEPAVIKGLPFARLKERLDRVCEHYGVTVDIHDPRIGAMSWDDARTLLNKGFTVGGHSTWHIILTNETIADAKEDIRRSITAVTTETGSQCPSFAFPNGNYSAPLLMHAMECGVETAMTTEPRWTMASSPAFRLPRLQLYNRYSGLLVALKIAAAAPGFLLANPDGSGRRYVWNLFRYGY